MIHPKHTKKMGKSLVSDNCLSIVGFPDLCKRSQEGHQKDGLGALKKHFMKHYLGFGLEFSVSGLLSQEICSWETDPSFNQNMMQLVSFPN